MYKLLIVDDEPLVQIGLRSMLAQGFDNIQVMGTASNGREALEQMEQNRPDIIIADIRMPLLSGLDLLKESAAKYGPVPVFIMLTAYEEFELARKALSLQAVDYLVKIELNPETLKAALDKAVLRVQEHSTKNSSSTSSMDEFRQKFFLRLFSRNIQNQETLMKQAELLQLDLNFHRFLVVYGHIRTEPYLEALTEDPKSQLFTLCSSAGSMSQEIITRYIPCYFVSVDLRHFACIFYFQEEQPVANQNNLLLEALSNAHSMILNYFNVSLRFGIGTAVSSVLNISDSFEEAKTAESHTTDTIPIHLFSHIAGSNRRSGKDKLISAVQSYIDENLNGHLLLNEVADVFGLSPAYLSVLFKKNASVGFSEYVNSRKIEKAKELLLSGDMKIYEVADALGFESAYYFSKVFKKVYGQSPREFIQSKTGE